MKLAANFHGLADIRSVMFPPPNIGSQTADEVRGHAAHVVGRVVEELMRDPREKAAAAPKRSRTNQRAIALRGNLEELTEYFHERRWTDGLPFIPPTIEAVERMLRFTDRDPDEVVGVLRPGKCDATVWKIAANAVMAGCRPEYMPILLSIIEAESEPDSGIEGFNSTSGQFPFIVLSGPIARMLEFNHGQGMVRGRRQANVSIARFMSLCLINIAQLRLGEADMSTFDRMFYPVVVEAMEHSPWEPVSVDLGFGVNDNVVTVQSAATVGYSFLTEGDAESHLRVLAQEVTRDLGNFDFLIHPMLGPATTPTIMLGPLVANVIAKAGYSKREVKEYLFRHARVPAHQYEDFMRRRRLLPNADPSEITMCEMVRLGRLPPIYCASDDPNRLVPVVQSPEEYMILVTGLPDRNRNKIMRQGGAHGKRVSKKIQLPKNWDALFRSNA